MTTSVQEMVEHHRDVAELYAEATKRYPNATIQYIGNQTVVYNQGGVTEDRIMVVGDRLVAYERIEGAGGWTRQLGHGRCGFKSTCLLRWSTCGRRRLRRMLG